MVLKNLRDTYQKSVFINQVYPVIAYRINSDNVKEYRIYDESRSFTWISDGIEIINESNFYYFEKIVNDEKMYLYKDIDDSFFTLFYLEGDDFEQIIDKLKIYMIEILSYDLSPRELSESIINVCKESNQIDVLLESFFLKAEEADISKFAFQLSDKLDKFCEAEIRILVNNMCKIKSLEIKDFFEKIVQCGDYSEEIMDVIYNYLYGS
ncbi:MAG: hypothetical protein ACI4AQ_06920 [Lachnospiraceae bacterium]